MAEGVASTKLGFGFGPINQGGVKAVIVSFATTATGDTLTFDASNVGRENAIAKITFAMVQQADGKFVATNTWASNVITVGQPIGATAMVAVVAGVGA